MDSLETLLANAIGQNGILVQGGRDSFAEVTDTTSGKVWMTLTPATQLDLDRLTLPEGFAPLGAAQSAMDAAGFCHALDGINTPVAVMEIDGRKFINVAQPETPEFPSIEDAPIKVMVNKAHVIGFQAGRTIAILETAQGSFVELVGTPENDDRRVLPTGAILRKAKLDAPLVIKLPSPTVTYFWMTPGDIRSFQGPCDLPC